MSPISESTCATCAPAPTKRISRRAVLKGAGAVTTVAVAVPGWGGLAFASNNANRVGDIVVNIFLRGGMDGLSVVVPRHDGAGANLLLAARPTIAIDPATLLPLNTDFGLHPVMAPLMGLWNAQRLALIPAAGFPNGDRSHFAAGRSAGGVDGVRPAQHERLVRRGDDEQPRLVPGERLPRQRRRHPRGVAGPARRRRHQDRQRPCP
jgi:uncharacterized membrane protein